MSTKLAPLLLALLSFQLLLVPSTAQNVCVACYESPVGECNSANQTSNEVSYADCCLQSESRNASGNSYETLIGLQICALCGPVLDIALFFPVPSEHNSSSILIQWGLKPRSIPATNYTLSVGLEREGEEGLTTVSIASGAQALRHQFHPVTLGQVYTISVTAINEELGVTSPAMTVSWRAGEDIFPAFTNFSASPLSSSGSLLASWMVLTPGLHPLIQITVRWVELSSVEDIHDLSDPTSPAYPQTNIAVVEYSTKRQEVMQNDIINVSLEGGFTVNETYLVAITGTSALGSKTTSFIFKVESNMTTTPTSGKQALLLPPLILTVFLSLSLYACF